jgi:hypothetical protein
MWNKIKNKLIVRLMKNTRLDALTCYAFVCKVNHNEITTYIRGYNEDKRTDKEKFDIIFNGTKRKRGK